MKTKFKVGDEASWNSEAGLVLCKVAEIHTADFDYKGYTQHASEEGTSYEIKCGKSDHIAVHKGSAFTKIRKQKDRILL